MVGKPVTAAKRHHRSGSAPALLFRVYLPANLPIKSPVSLLLGRMGCTPTALFQVWQVSSAQVQRGLPMIATATCAMSECNQRPRSGYISNFAVATSDRLASFRYKFSGLASRCSWRSTGPARRHLKAGFCCENQAAGHPLAHTADIGLYHGPGVPGPDYLRPATAWSWQSHAFLSQGDM